jgi:hypothetical protein
VGTAIAPSLGEVALEQVGGLDDVVVDTDEDQVVDLHSARPLHSRLRLFTVTGSSFGGQRQSGWMPRSRATRWATIVFPLRSAASRDVASHATTDAGTDGGAPL